MHRPPSWRRLLALPISLAFIAGGALAGAAPSVAADPEPFVTATPASLSTTELAATGVRLQGLSRDTGGPIQRQDITVSAPSGAETPLRDFTPDGTFDKTFKPDAADVELGTYTVESHGFVAEDASATTTFLVTEEETDGPATIVVSPKSISRDDFENDGVLAEGTTSDVDGTDRTTLVVESPNGQSASYSDNSNDGSFRKRIRPKNDLLTDPIEIGTYTVTASSRSNPDQESASTTFEVTAPPATVTVDPTSISQDDFKSAGVLATGTTLDTASDSDATVLRVTSTSGNTAKYSDSSSDGSFRKRIRPKNDLLTDPIETGTYTLTATSRSNPDYSASTTFEVTSSAPPTEPRDPEANADPMILTQSEFLNGGVNLFGFTEDTPGPLTRQRIQVTIPGGDTIDCADFTGDGTYDIQVYPRDAPESGPDGKRTCDLADGGVALPGMGLTPFDLTPVPVGTYQVTSFGFISEDARATTSFEVVADPDNGGGDNGGGDNGGGDNGGGDNGGGDNGGGDNGDDGNGNGGGNASGVLPDTGAGSTLPLWAGLGLLAVGAAIAAPRRRMTGRHLA